MLIVHLASGLLGISLIYLTFVMKESTEGRWINRLEELWIRVDDRSKSTRETTEILFGTLAGKVTAFFERIFGQRMISARVAGISGSLSFASLLLICGIGLEILMCVILAHSEAVKHLGPKGVYLVNAIPLLIILGVCFLLGGCFCLVLATLPMMLRSPFWAWLSCLPPALWLLGTFRLALRRLAYEQQLGITGALALSIASDVLLLALIRRSLNWIQSRTTVPRMLTAIGAQALVLCLVFVIPFSLPIIWRPELAKANLGQAMFITAVFNIPTAVAATAFDALLLVVLLHRVSWPLLSDWVLVLNRNDVLEKRKTVRAIGAALILYGMSGNSGTLLKIAEKILQ